MKTQQSKPLEYNKKSIVELNTANLSKIYGGTNGTTTALTKLTDIINYSKNTFCNSDAK